MIIDLTDTDFYHEIEKSSLPYLVHFWAIWSPACIAEGQILEEIDQKFAGRLKIARVNVDNELKTANDCAVQNIPTIIIFQNGVEVERIVGSITKELLIKKIRRYIIT